ncbi:DUF1294 domain-containing protein [Erythrobacter sp. SD-21]|uniref:DUF1294 domain-containing protein n=1 Tax=Erythrobacter sp. SD-21 TaxID=161528 RepID=UPI000153F47D|nr:DUF1294 domain-containing protein [Erythrobacter sp. SD-21]EDL49579.1 putative inner membrane protein [Erythrobacter sp. SD-21]
MLLAYEIMGLFSLTPETIAYALILVNLVSFAIFGIDKALAETGSRRISEDTLVFWAAVGGTPGAFAGRALFRHKTRKQPFSSYLKMILASQGALLCFWVFTIYRGV